MKKVLVAGGAGFIGSHLTDLLLSERYSVICLDNLITGSLDNLKQAQQNPNFKFINQDICEAIKIDEPLDFILNLASPASPVDYQKFAVETLKTGSIGTLNLLDLARAKKARFLLASTSEVYGDPQASPQSENYWGNVNPIGPRSMYDEAKRFAEALTVNYARVHGIQTKIIRIFNTYGPRMQKDDGRVVPNFICQALNNQPLTIYGDGSQTRSFCYVSDLIDGIYRVMFSEVEGPINLGNPEEFTILEFARLIARIVGVKFSVSKKPLPENDPKQRKPDITKANKILGFSPKVGLKEGIEKAVAWFKNKQG